MNLKNKIQDDIKNALRGGEKEKLETLRYLFAEIKYKELENKKKELADEEILKIISSQLKKLEESLSFFKKGNREELVKKTEAEIIILKTYLPKQISDEELEKEIEKIIKNNPNPPHPGVLIGIAVKKLSGKADNGRISQLIMKKLKQA